MKLVLLLCFFLASGGGLWASHYIGSTITYECLGANVYRVHFHFYADCQGISPNPNNVAVVGIGGGCTAPTATAWTLQSSNDVTYLAPTLQTTCASGPYPGMKDFHYTRDYDFTGVSCTQYKFQYQDCCRYINTNLTNPMGTGYSVTTDTLHLSFTSCNNSPVWHNPPALIAISTQDNYFDMGGLDPDGDSLVYSFSIPQDHTYNPVVYNIGYSVSQPLGPNWIVKLDAETGLLSVLPGSSPTLEMASLCIRVDEYRNGTKIGSVVRDFELRVLASLPANQLPSISGPFNLTGAKLIGSNIVVAPGSSMCVDFSASDPDAGVATQLSWMSDLVGGMLTDTFGAGPDTVFAVGPWARVCWTAPNHLGMDTLTITAIDTTRQLNNMVISRHAFTVGDTALVWPGDADNNLVANIFDLLPIGLSYLDTGPARTGASNSWVGQECLPWLDTIPGGIDKKFADCDGNGVVNINDTLPLFLNYGLTHTKADIPVARGTTVDPPLKLLLPDSADVGDTITAPIILGDSSVSASNVYGYAFTLHYDASLIDSSTFWIDFDNSWLGNSSNSIDLFRNHPFTADCDGGQVRINHTVVSGMGEVCRAHFVIIDNIDGKRQTLDSAMLSIFFTDVRVIGLNGDIAVDAQSDSMMIYELTVETGGAPVAPEVHVYPNPAADVLNIEVRGQEIEELEVMNVHGQRVMDREGLGGQSLRLDVSSFARGMYFVRVKAETGWVMKRVVVE